QVAVGDQQVVVANGRHVAPAPPVVEPGGAASIVAAGDDGVRPGRDDSLERYRGRRRCQRGKDVSATAQRDRLGYQVAAADRLQWLVPHLIKHGNRRRSSEFCGQRVVTGTQRRSGGLRGRRGGGERTQCFDVARDSRNRLGIADEN